MIFTLFSLLFLFGLSHASSCPTVSTHICTCDAKWNNRWRLTCVSQPAENNGLLTDVTLSVDDIFLSENLREEISIVMDYAPNKGLKVECLSSSSQNLTPELFFNISDVSKLHFVNCRFNFTVYDLLSGRSVAKLKFQSLKSLPENLFSRLTGLKILDLSRNRLKEIPKDLFDDVKSLKILNLNMNGITTLPVGVFQNLSNLTHLILSYNKISNLPEGVFSGLGSLQNLILFKNNLLDIPEDTFSNFLNLKVLDLSFNKIQNLPTYMLSNLHELLRFEFKSNLIDDIPFEFFANNSKLERIDLSGNRLDFLHDDVFANLENLKEIKASDNRIKLISPMTFSRNSKLKEVHLKGNFIRSPEELFSNLSALRIVDLSENPLANLSFKFFSKQHNLEWLSLARCSLLSIPADLFKSTSSLKYLDLSYNILNESSLQALEDLSNLEHLKLKSNGIEYLKTLPFGDSSGLETVDLSYNRLHDVSNVEWFNYPRLKSLNLENNLFETFAVPRMQSNPLVYLKNNYISKISVEELKLSESFKIVQKLRLPMNLFYFRPNPINCNCELYDFYKMVTREYTVENMPLALFPDAVNLVCSSPPELAGTKLGELNDGNFRCEISTNCPTSCTCYKRSRDHAVVVNCTSKYLTALPESLPQSTSVVHLENNQISNLDFLGSIWENCTELYLANNIIKTVDVPLPGGIQKLSLNDNLLTELSTDFLHWLEKDNLEVFLARNPYKCRSPREIRHILIDRVKKIKDFDFLTCFPDDTSENSEIPSCLHDKSISFQIQLFLFIVAIAILSVFLLFVYLHYYVFKPGKSV